MAISKQSNKPIETPVQKAKPTKKQIAEAVEKTKNKAEEYTRDPQKAQKLLDDAVKKTKTYEKNRGSFSEVWGYLTALIRLLRAYIRKDYQEIPWETIVLVIGAVIYFVSPIDLIPDWLPLGFVDDAAVIAFVIKRIKTDLDDFLAWEVEQSGNESAV